MTPLVRRRLLRIAPGRTRRELLAVLSAPGQRLIERALPAWEETQRRFVEALGARTWTILASTLPHVPSVARALERRRTPAARAGMLRPGTRQRRPLLDARRERTIFGRMGLTPEAREELAARIVHSVPVKRFGDAREIALAAVFLASDG